MANVPSTVVTQLHTVGNDGSFAVPLTHEQARLWFLVQADPSDIRYHMAYRLELVGQVNVQALKRAFDDVVRRHEPLRTHFDCVDGVPHQIVRPAVPLEVEEIDLLNQNQEADALSIAARLERLQEELVAHPFDLAVPVPLVRLRLVRCAPERYCLIFVMHHIVGDGWSHAILVRDWSAFYRADVTEQPRLRPCPLSVQYSDYALWQQTFLASDACAQQVRYWIDELKDVREPLRLPRDGQTSTGTLKSTSLRFTLPSTLGVLLRAQLEQHGQLLSALLLAPYEALLARFTDQEEFAVGIAISHRPTESLGELVGFFVNTVALRCDIQGNPNGRELLRRVTERLLQAQAHAAAPLDRVLAGLHACGAWGETPLINAMFVLQNAPAPRFELPQVEASVERLPTRTFKFDLTLLATPRVRDGVAVAVDFEFEYDPRLLARSSAECLRDAYLDLMRHCWSNADARLLSTSLDTYARPSRASGPCSRDAWRMTVAQRIEYQVQSTPDAVAVEDLGVVLTYRELLETALEYAAVLRLHGVRRGDIVALALPRGASLIVAVLGLWSAGAAYAPVDPEIPAQRLVALLHALEPRGVVWGEVSAAGADFFKQLPAPLQQGTGPAAEGGRGKNKSSISAAADICEPKDLAYVIHTSGSTGQPKWVLVEHAGLANVCTWIASTLALSPGDRCLFKTPITFDAAVRELFPTLMSGATLVVAPPDSHRDMPLLSVVLATAKVSIAHFVPTQLSALVELSKLPSTLRAVMCGGERLPGHVARQFGKISSARLWNVYGPTEATVDALAYEVRPDMQGEEDSTVPVGCPLANMTVTIVDRYGCVLPRGAIGEIQLSGVGIARGYRGTRIGASGFWEVVVDATAGLPPCQAAVSRSYATGDIGRMRSDGTVEFLGRQDRQIKRHGVRLEPVVIESALLRHPAVGAAHVACLEVSPISDGMTPSRLIAFVAPKVLTPQLTAPDAAVATRWRAVFEASYEGLVAETSRTTTHGWTARSDRSPIPPQEVISAADSAAARVLRWRPRRVLEIGCGAGLLLLRIAPHCELYDGVDFSRHALQYLQAQVIEAGLDQVRLVHADARGFIADESAIYDAIVVHSVVQYLSATSELSDLLRRWRNWLAPGGIIFVGDVRDARLVHVQAFNDALARAAPDVTLASLQRNADQLQARDEELCLHPSFFEEWVRNDGDFAPSLVELKTSEGDNELVRYRFDVTLARWPRERSLRASLQSRLSARYAAVPIANTLLQASFQLLRLLPSLPHDTSVAQLREAAKSWSSSGGGRTPAQASAEAQRVACQSGHEAACWWLCRGLDDKGTFDLIRIAAEMSPSEVAETYGGVELPTQVDPMVPGAFSQFLQAVEDLPSFLRQFLASYEMPERIVPLATVPTTRHGKIDLRQLREVAEAYLAHEGYQPADSSLNPIEATVCEVFSAVVGVPIAVDDDFFMRGGHSLLATRARTRLSQHFGIELDLRWLFDAPRPRALAKLIKRQIERLDSIAKCRRDRITPRQNKASAYLTHAQRRLWFIERLGTAPGVYHMSHALRLRGELDQAALEQAIADLFERHAPLRSRFPNWLDQPTVVIDPPCATGMLERVDGLHPMTFQEALDRLQASATRPFDLQHQRLVRVSLTRLHTGTTKTSFLLGIVAHHIVADGWSMALAISELSQLYSRRRKQQPTSLPPLTPDYYDVAAWQARELARGAFHDQLEYWWSSLTGAPKRLQLPYDHPAPVRRTWRGEKLPFDISASLVRQVKRVAARTGATDFMTLLAVFEVLLSKLSGMTDFVVGTVIANRHRPEYEPLVGLLVNPLALRARVSPGESFDQLLRRVRADALSAFENQDAPFEKVLEGLEVDRRTDYQAGFQVLFVLQNAGGVTPFFEGMDCERIRLQPTGAMFDLCLEVAEHGSTWRAELEYSTDLFRKDTAHLLIDRYLHLLENCAGRHSCPLGELTLTPEAERTQLLAWSRGPELLSPKISATLYHRIARAAEGNPNGVAIDDGAAELTYRQLMTRAAAMADDLWLAGVRRGQRVGLHMPRDADVVVAGLAVQSIGAAVAYLDPDMPEQRLRSLWHAARLDHGLTSAAVPPLDDLSWITGRDVGGTGTQQRQRDAAMALDRAPTEEDIAFAGFTSGTSGPPKAVLVSHRALIQRLTANDIAVSPLSMRDRVAHCYTLNYDGGLLSLYWPLCTGATVVFLPLSLLGDARAFADALVARKITVLDTIPAVLTDLFNSEWQSDELPLRLVLTGGDVCPPSLPQQVLSRADVIFANQYGPCEAVINATTWRTDKRSTPRLPSIGRPLPGANVYVMDERNRLCGIGVPGEIVIGGDSLASGYVDAPELTADRFPSLDIDGCGKLQRVYRTGDRGRWTTDGEIEFLGRQDRQVQIRGMRSDPREIESMLQACAEVEQCHVVIEGDECTRHFVAYVVPRDDDALAPIRADRLPASTDSDPAQQRLLEWRALFDALYQPSLSRLIDDAMDCAGWDDTATGKPIEASQMRAWIHATYKSIKQFPLDKMSSVLEIGAGLGLVTFMLAPNVSKYVATDASMQATARLHAIAARLALPQLEILCLNAANLLQLDGRSFDLIVLNSVVQYFPSAGFLQTVLEHCARLLRPGGRVFVGDVRDVRLARQFHCEVIARRNPGLRDASKLNRLAVEAERVDEELHLAPAFFHQLATGLGGLWRSMPLLKVRAGHSEMARYRYDVWLQLESEHESVSEETREISWQNGREDWVRRLQQILHQNPNCVLRVRDVPNSRLTSSDATMHVGLHAGRSHHVTSGEIETTAIDPDAMLGLGETVARPVIVQPAQGENGARFDAVFLPATWSEQALLATSDRASLSRHNRRLQNRPLLGRLTPGLRASVAAQAARRLAPHLCPSRYVIADHLPQDDDGRTDESALALLFAEPPPMPTAAASDVRLGVMEDLWSALLGTQEIDGNADFFAIGGHSLLAARLTAAIRREFAVELPVLKVFELRTMAAITREVECLRAQSSKKTEDGRTDLTYAAPVIDWRATPSPLPCLSLWQRRLLGRLQHLSPQRPNHIGLSLEIARPLDVGLLREAWAAVQAIHPLLMRDHGSPSPTVLPATACTVRDLRRSNEGSMRWVAETMNLTRSGPLTLALVRDSRGCTRLAVRAHPAFVDSDSLLVVLLDLASAEHSLRRNEQPLRGRIATDYAAFAIWEAANRSIFPCDTEGTPRPLPTHPTLQSSPDGSVTHIITNWSVRQTAVLDAVAARIGVSPCAVLLGALAMQSPGQGSDICIECPISLRDSLHGQGVVGPFAVDVPLTLSAASLGRLGDAAVCAIEQIATLLDHPIKLAAMASEPPSAGRWSFNYQDRFVGADTSPWTGFGTWVRSRELHTMPLWTELKLSALRMGGQLQLRLSADASLLDNAEAALFLEQVFQSLAKEVSPC